MASEINRFVNDLGIEYRSKTEMRSAERIIDENPARFDPLTHLSQAVPETYTNEELSALFDTLLESPDAVTPAFEHHYYRWIEAMIVSFLLKGQIIDYDIAANNRMGELINSIIR